MKKLVPIGQFSRLTGLSVSALRFYAQIGLLCPASTDPRTGYRFYRREQTLQAERIRLLRSLDIAVEDIGLFLREDDPEQAQHLIERHRRAVEERIATYRQALATLDLLAHGQGLPYPVSVKDVPAQTVLFRRFHTTLASIEQTREEGLRALHGWLDTQGIPPSGPDVLLLVQEDITSPTDGLGLEWRDAKPWTSLVDLAVPISRPVQPEPPLGCALWPAVTVAFTTHQGPYEPLHLASRAVRAWVTEHHLRFVGPKREVYLRGPLDTRDRSRLQTEVHYPVLAGPP